MTEKRTLHDILLQLEEHLLQTDVRHDAEELKKHFTEEFREFSSSGRVYDREAIIESLGVEEDVKVEIENFKVVNLSDKIILATYHALFTDEKSNKKSTSLRSSIWEKFVDDWKMIFHQGTPTSDSDK